MQEPQGLILAGGAWRRNDKGRAVAGVLRDLSQIVER
jgi:hypothetical protein